MLAGFLSLNIGLQFLFFYIIAINIVTFFYYGWDKCKSQVGALRINEKTLWLLALVGGSAGALLGMHFFRHKTKKLSFQAVLSVIVAFHVWILLALYT